MNRTAFISTRDPKNTRAIPGALFHFLATGEQTAGDHSLIEIQVLAGNEPPAHTHEHEDEMYFILEGRMRFEVGERTIDATPGSYVYLPRGVQHSFKVNSDRAHVLMWLTPAGLEQWFWDNSAPVPDMLPMPLPAGPPPPELVQHFVSSLAEYGVHMAPVPVN